MTNSISRPLLYAGGLAVALLLSYVFSDAESESPDSVVELATSLPTAKSAITTNKKPWPKSDPSDIAAYDPFTWDGKSEVRSAAPTDGAAGTPTIAGNSVEQGRTSPPAEQHQAQIILKSPTGDAIMAGNRILRTGDTVDGWTVKKIELDAVLYSRDSTSFTRESATQ